MPVHVADGVLLAVLRGRHRDVVQRRKLAPQPRAGIVLIRDRVDAQPRRPGVHLRRRCEWRARAAAPAPACWRRPTPAPRAAGCRSRSAALTISSAPGDMRSGAHRVHAVRRLSADDHGAQGVGRRKPPLMGLEVWLHARVGVEQRANHVGTHPVLHPGRGRRDEPLDVEVVRVDEKPHHRHLVVGLVGDVGHDDDARASGVGIDARRRGHVAGSGRPGPLPGSDQATAPAKPTLTRLSTSHVTHGVAGSVTRSCGTATCHARVGERRLKDPRMSGIYGIPGR